MGNVFKLRGRNGKKSPIYYGKLKLAPGRWKRVALFSDKTASRRRLADMQRQTDQGSAGVMTAQLERLRRPLAELSKDYHVALRLQRKRDDHVRISEWMLKRLFELASWKMFADITPESLDKALAMLAAQGRTASYQNKFIARARAFVHWLLPEGWINPLKRVKRINERGAKRTRARRAASDAELTSLLALADLPDNRRLAYALASLNGLRRNEIAGLKWNRLKLAATIPFVELSQKQGTDDSLDNIPLHPYVVKLLNDRGHGMPAMRVLPSVPDVATLEKDLRRVGLSQKDEQGQRLDFHALRHTFQTNLERIGTSRSTRKKLMRHAHEDQTDGYGHSELGEMLAALQRLSSPLTPAVAAIKTGTDGQPVDQNTSPQSADHPADQAMEAHRDRAGFIGNMSGNGAIDVNDTNRTDLPGDETVRDDERSSDLLAVGSADIVPEIGPSTQVD